MITEKNKRMKTPVEIEKIENDVRELLKSVIDPEVEINLVDLGLIYNIDYDGDKNFDITMTLSTPSCPIGDSIVMNVMQTVNEAYPGYDTNVNLTFDPPWTPDMISEEGKKALNK